MTRFFVLFALFGSTHAQEDWLWNRWEARTIDCVSSTKRGDCTLIAPEGTLAKDIKEYKCRIEPMPQADWNPLARNSTTRIACPIGCEPNFDLSVLQKVPYVNPACQKYYTYGKYRDHKENDWYLWMTEPCIAKISTHCRFKDIPVGVKSEQKHRQV